jgi:hypothetical protein
MTRLIGLRAALLALPLLGGTAASAADIYDRHPAPRYGTAYDDPRYADIYGRDQPPRYAAPPPPYADRYAPPPPYGPRDRYGYLPPLPEAPRFDQRQSRPYSEPGCLPREQIRQMLIEDGWREFQDLEIASRFVSVTARRSNGNAYRLKVDRCSGEIARADLIDSHPGSYAGRPGYYRSY